MNNGLRCRGGDKQESTQLSHLIGATEPLVVSPSATHRIEPLVASPSATHRFREDRATGGLFHSIRKRANVEQRMHSSISNVGRGADCVCCQELPATRSP